MLSSCLQSNYTNHTHTHTYPETSIQRKYVIKDQNSSTDNLLTVSSERKFLYTALAEKGFLKVRDVEE